MNPFLLYDITFYCHLIVLKMTINKPFIMYTFVQTLFGNRFRPQPTVKGLESSKFEATDQKFSRNRYYIFTL